MIYNTIHVQDDGMVRTVTLQRAERRNAMTPEMQTELIHAFEGAAEAQCRALILRGSGSAFCAGLDLSVLRQMDARSDAEHRADAERIARLFRTLYELPLPTIAAVHGAAMAGGAGLAIVCDFTLATPQAEFAFTEARIGFVPALVSAYLALQIGDKRSRDLLLTARRLSAVDAHRIGLVNEIVPEELLAQRSVGLARELLQNSPESLRATKRLMAAQNKTWLDTAVEAAMEANARARGTDDFREGISAFLEKRRPSWTDRTD